MQSSKRTLRSHEIPINEASLLQLGSSNTSTSLGNIGGNVSGSGGGLTANLSSSSGLNIMQQGNAININDRMMNSSGQSGSAVIGSNTGNVQLSSMLGTPGNIGNSGIGTSSIMISGGGLPLAETELDLNFSLQYPHFIKRDGNRCV